MAGYSKRKLAEKLGLKPGSRLHFVGAPKEYFKELGAFPGGAVRVGKLAGEVNFIHLFVARKNDLEKKLPALKKFLAPDGAFWISWPKGGSDVATDLKEGVVQSVGLANGLVDIKVCAVTKIWSGLKFVIPVAKR